MSFSCCFFFKGVIYRQFIFIVYNFEVIWSLFVFFFSILVESFHICTVLNFNFVQSFTVTKRSAIGCWLTKRDESITDKRIKITNAHALSRYTLRLITLANRINLLKKQIGNRKKKRENLQLFNFFALILSIDRKTEERSKSQLAPVYKSSFFFFDFSFVISIQRNHPQAFIKSRRTFFIIFCFSKRDNTLSMMIIRFSIEFYSTECVHESFLLSFYVSKNYSST